MLVNLQIEKNQCQNKIQCDEKKKIVGEKILFRLLNFHDGSLFWCCWRGGETNMRFWIDRFDGI